MKNYSKSNNVVNEYEDVYLENLESKEYFEYLLKYKIFFWFKVF